MVGPAPAAPALNLVFSIGKFSKNLVLVTARIG
jgi:hypothetical protein